MESTLTRQEYGLKELVQNFYAKPAEIKTLFANPLDPTRASELRDRMRLAGLPICTPAGQWQRMWFRRNGLQSRADDCSLSCN